MMKTSLLLALSVISFTALGDYTLTTNDLEEDPDGMPGEQIWEGDLTLGKDVIHHATIHVTNKGNGELNIANLSLAVYDGHRNPAMYKDQMLLIELTDLNDDGYLDLMITGIYQITPEQGDGVLDESVVIFMCHFNPKTNQFKKIYQQMPLELEEHFKVNL